MPEESVKQKFLKVARRVLTMDPQSIDNTYVVLRDMPGEISHSNFGIMIADFPPIMSQDSLPGLTLSLLDFRPRSPAGCEGTSPSNSASQLLQPIVAYFHSVSPTSRSKSFSTSFYVAPNHLSKTHPFQSITRSPPSGFPSHRSAGRGGLLLTPVHPSGPRSRQTLTFTGLTSCNSALSLSCSTSTFAWVGATLTIVK
jgi:hypothetical protein